MAGSTSTRVLAAGSRHRRPWLRRRHGARPVGAARALRRLSARRCCSRGSLIDQGTVHHRRRSSTILTRPAPAPRLLEQPAAGHAGRRAAARVLGFLFAFTAARGRLPRWLARPSIDAERAAAAGLAAVHHGDRDDLLVRAARAHHVRAAGTQGRDRLRPRRARCLSEIAHLLSRSPTSRCARSSPAIDSNIEGMAFVARRLALARVPHRDAAARHSRLANAFLLLFAASLADFATPLILAGNQFPVLPTQAYLQITGLFDLRGRRRAVVRAARAGARRLPAAAVLGEPALLRHGHRQGRRASPVRQHLARDARRRCSPPARRSRSSSSTSTRSCSMRRS